VHGLRSISDSRDYKMILWEGAFLVAVVALGGGALIFLTYSFAKRHERMRMFFATFAHDLKTSLARMRLQGEILEEKSPANPKLSELMANIHRLDLQLENSLWMANFDDNKLVLEDLSLQELMSSLRHEFPDLQLHLSQNAIVHGDRRALRVVFRNLFQNSLIHGNASEIFLTVKKKSSSKLQVSITDNGKGPVHENMETNGIGLYLTKKIVLRLGGDCKFLESPQFTNEISLLGHL
jgi:signal transduction histidine kinase